MGKVLNGPDCNRWDPNARKGLGDPEVEGVPAWSDQSAPLSFGLAGPDQCCSFLGRAVAIC